MQRPAIQPAAQLGSAARSLAPGHVGGHGDERVGARVELLDPRQIGLGQLERRQFPARMSAACSRTGRKRTSAATGIGATGRDPEDGRRLDRVVEIELAYDLQLIEVALDGRPGDVEPRGIEAAGQQRGGALQRGRTDRRRGLRRQIGRRRAAEAERGQDLQDVAPVHGVSAGHLGASRRPPATPENFRPSRSVQPDEPASGH